MTWQIQRDGFTAEWISFGPMAPFVRVTGPGIASEGLEFAVPQGGTLDACDLMHACITYGSSMAMLPRHPPGTEPNIPLTRTVIQSLRIIRRAAA